MLDLKCRNNVLLTKYLMCNIVLRVYGSKSGPLAEFNIYNFKPDELICFEFSFTLKHSLLSAVLASSAEMLDAQSLWSSEDGGRAAAGGCGAEVVVTLLL